MKIFTGNIILVWNSNNKTRYASTNKSGKYSGVIEKPVAYFVEYFVKIKKNRRKITRNIQNNTVKYIAEMIFDGRLKIEKILYENVRNEYV